MAHTERMTLARFWSLARQREANGQLSSLSQVKEAALLRFKYGVGLGYYQLAAFWDRSVPWRDKIGHLSAGEYRKIISTLNPPNYRKLSQNKLAEKSIFSLLGIPSPEYLGYYHPKTSMWASGSTLGGSDALYRYLAENVSLDNICFKGVEGWAGQSFEAVEILRESDELELLRLRNGDKLSVRAFCDSVLNQGQHTSGSIIEKFLLQHEVLRNINPSSLNTLRVWVLEGRDGLAEVLLAYLRIGRAGAIVDNQSSGGIVAPVDLEKGTLQAAIDGTSARKTFSIHPDHGAPIEAVEMPYFRQAMELAKRTVLEFPGMRFAGVDVAIADDGPKIIELNVSPDRVGAAFTQVPSKRVLQ